METSFHLLATAVRNSNLTFQILAHLSWCTKQRINEVMKENGMRADEGVVTDMSVISLKYVNIKHYNQSKQQKTKFLLNSCIDTSTVHFSISLTFCHLTLNATKGRRERIQRNTNGSTPFPRKWC
jgi:hypothetical protein